MIAKLAKYTERKTIFVYLMLFTVSEVIFSIIKVYIPKNVIKLLSVEELLLPQYITTILIMFLVFVLSGIISSFSLNTGKTLMEKIKLDSTYSLYSKITRLKYKYLEDAEFLDSNNMIFNVVERYDSGIEGVWQIAFRIPPNLIICVVLCGLFARMDFILLFVIVLSWIVKLQVSKKLGEQVYMNKSDLGKAKRKMQYFYNMTHDFHYGKDIRMFGLKEHIINDYSNQIEKYLGILKKIYKVHFKRENMYIVLSMISDALIFGILIYKVVNNEMMIADFVMYLSCITMLREKMESLNSDYAKWKCEKGFVLDFFSFIENKDIEEGGSSGNDISTDNGYEICFENVSFKYPKTDKYVLRNISFTIRQGEKIAFVGINGAGKSTIIKLLLRLYSPTQGHIKINNQDIENIDIDSLRDIYAVVFQDICAYPLSVKENIVADSINNEVMLQALESNIKITGFDEVVSKLKSGLDSKLYKSVDSDGIDLSGGEKQKMAITRALFRNASVTIFDEPTAALDAFAEEELYKYLGRVLAQKTVIFISHRLESTKFCDRIYLISDNKIVESGTFNELISKNGFLCIAWLLFCAIGKLHNRIC